MSTHGKDGFLEIDDAGGVARNISPYLDTIEPTYSNDIHDDTTFGQDGHTKRGGLTDGSINIGGLWDKTADVGTRIVLRGLVGKSEPVDFTYGPEGNTTGLVKDTGKFVLENYQESVPVADLIRFTATLQISGTVTSGTFA